MENYISFIEVCAMFNVHAFIVYEYCRDNNVPYVKTRKHVGYMRKADLAKHYNGIRDLIIAKFKEKDTVKLANGGVVCTLYMHRNTEANNETKPSSSSGFTRKVHFSESGDLYRVDTFSNNAKNINIWNEKHKTWKLLETTDNNADLRVSEAWPKKYKLVP